MDELENNYKQLLWGLQDKQQKAFNLNDYPLVLEIQRKFEDLLLEYEGVHPEDLFYNYPLEEMLFWMQNEESGDEEGNEENEEGVKGIEGIEEK